MTNPLNYVGNPLCSKCEKEVSYNNVVCEDCREPTREMVAANKLFKLCQGGFGRAIYVNIFSDVVQIRVRTGLKGNSSNIFTSAPSLIEAVEKLPEPESI